MASSPIASVRGLEILDSRGNPTVEVLVKLRNGTAASAAVPSGASTGTHEALELRDDDPKRYGGKGVLKAISSVNRVIAPKLKGKNSAQQQAIDQLMLKLDGTPNKAKLGANAILGVSLAVAHAAAKAAGKPLYRHIRSCYRLPYKTWKLPTPTMNILNGGAHADWLIDIQEFMIVPQQKKFREKIRCGSEVFHALGALLKERGFSTLKGDEGGYAPKLPGNEMAFGLIMEAIGKAGYVPGQDVKLAIDAAASEFYTSGTYELKADRKKLSSTEMIRLIGEWIKKYPLLSVEDGLAEDDWEHWTELTREYGKKVLLVGDDLFVTNVERLRRGITRKVGNAILIKLNQIGTLTETIAAIELAHKNKYATSISHRSGETCDTTIADLAVAVNSEYIKTGSLSRSERVGKYNRLLAIESELGV